MRLARKGVPLRDELLYREILYTVTEAKVLIERSPQQYNPIQPHSALDYGLLAPEAVTPTTDRRLDMTFALSQ